MASSPRAEALERRTLLSFGSIGTEFPVNQASDGSQTQAAVAADANGDFVVAWQSNAGGQDGSGYGVYARRYNANGVAQQVPGATAGVTEFRVNTYTADNQREPAVAMDADGDFVVTWQTDFQDGDLEAVYAQRFNAAGVPQGKEFQVNTHSRYTQWHPSVGIDAGGDFVIAWESFGQDVAGTYGVYAKRYAAGGAERAPPPGALAGEGNEFRVNTYTTDNQAFPSVAVDAGGDFVVAWESVGQDGSKVGVFAKRYNAAGQELVPPAGTVPGQGNEFLVNTVTTGNQFGPRAAMDYRGDFVIAWIGVTPNPNGDLFFQRFDVAGAPQGGEVKGSPTYTGGRPDVTMDADGDFLLTWTSFDLDGSDRNVYVRRYSAGVADNNGVRVNTRLPDRQVSSAVAMDAAGDAVVAWASLGQDAAGTYGIYAQRYDESTDTAGPIVTGVVADGTEVAPAKPINHAVTSLSVRFSENLSVAGGTGGATSAANPANYGLTRDAGGGVSDVSSLITAVAFALNAATNKYEAALTLSAPLLDGAYVLTARQALRDPAGNALDGDRDGIPGGGDYSLAFAVRSVVPTGGEFPVNVTTSFDQYNPEVAVGANGNFVVAWEDRDGVIYVRRYNSAGVPQQAPGLPPGTTEFEVNTTAVALPGNPSVAMDADGDFVIA